MKTETRRLQVALILNVCLQLLIEHLNGQTDLYPLRQQDNRAISLLDGEAIPYPETVSSILTEWITESLDKWGKVYIYTCPDNAMISIDPETKDLLDALAMDMAYQVDEPELKDILYIFKD